MHAIQSSPLVQAIGWTLLQSLWQIALVGIVLWLLLNFISKKSAQLSYAFSTSALLVVCVWTGLTFSNYWNFSFSKKEIATIEAPVNNIPATQLSPTETIIETAPIQIPSPTNIEASIFNLEMMLPFFVFAWLLGILFFGIQFTRGWLYLKKLKTTKLPLPDIRWQNQINTFAQRMGIQKNVQFFLSEKINSPLTFGHFKPIILFPATMLTGLSDEQIEMLLLHELAHIRRSDFLINLVQSILEVILFYHPVVWWISKQVRDSREHCCDDMAVAICKDRFLYAKTLTEIQSSIFAKKSLAMSATGSQGSFTYRIQRLFQQSNHKSSYTKSIFSFGLLAICVMMFAFQSPFFESEEKMEEEIISFIVTPENSTTQLHLIKQTLEQKNIDVETHYFYNQNSAKIETHIVKFTLPDKSTYQFDAEELYYALISLDWTKACPLTVFVKAKESCSSTFAGSESYIARQILENSRNNICTVGDFSFQRKNSFSNLEFLISTGNEKNSVFILNQNKISKSALRQRKLKATDIFSIKKLSTVEGAKVYEIITKDKMVYRAANKDCKRKILWGDKVFDDSDGSFINLSAEEFLELKNQKIQLNYCDTIHELIHFELQIQQRDIDYSLIVEDYRKEKWQKEVIDFLSKGSINKLIEFTSIYSTTGMIKPIGIVVGKGGGVPVYMMGGGTTIENDNGYLHTFYNPESTYLKNYERFNSYDDGSLNNTAFLLNEKRLQLKNNKQLPKALDQFLKIDSIISVCGNYAKQLFPQIDSDTIIAVYSNFQKPKVSDETSFTVANGIIFQMPEKESDSQKTILLGGPIKIKNEHPIDENFNPPLYFLNGIKLSIPEGEKLPIDVQNLEVMDSIIILTGKKATDIYGDEGKHGVWLIYATDEPLDIEIVNHQFSVDEKSTFEKSIQVHPNPMIDEAFISFQINGGQHLRLQIFDDQGKIITTIIDGIGFPGFSGQKMIQGYYWRPKNIPSGIYYARIEVGGEVFTKKIIKINQ